jgi:hypothetical protein
MQKKSKFHYFLFVNVYKILRLSVNDIFILGPLLREFQKELFFDSFLQNRLQAIVTLT